MAKSFNDAVTIMKKVVGEQDGQNPDATNSEFLAYVVDFYELQMSTDVESYDLSGFWTFTTVANTDTYSFKDEGYVFLSPPIYLTDSDSNDVKLTWYQSPDMFYRVHPVDNTNETAGKPFDALFYQDQLLLRPKPDDAYTITVKAYKSLSVPTVGGDPDGTADIEQDYFVRYLAYGASLDYLSDYGDFETYAKVAEVFKRYRSLVLMKTAKQFRSQRPKPAL